MPPKVFGLALKHHKQKKSLAGDFLVGNPPMPNPNYLRIIEKVL